MLFGTGLSAIAIIVFLEIVLCVDSIALAVNAKNKIILIVHALLAVLWAACAVLNIVQHLL